MAEMGDNAFRDDDGEVKGKLVCQIARETSKNTCFDKPSKNGRVFLLKTLDARLNLEYPLLLCKGSAKTKGLQ